MRLASKLELLVDIGVTIRDHLRSNGQHKSNREIVGKDRGDVIFGIDKAVHPIIEDKCKAFALQNGTIEVVGEGLGKHGKVIFPGPSNFCGSILIDPIDGTRGLMYDLRPAWFLAAWCDPCKSTPAAENAQFAAMVELPTSKQTFSDILYFSHEFGTRAVRQDLIDQSTQSLSLLPSGSTNLEHGFVSVSDFFFPGTGTLASELMTFLAEECAGPQEHGSAFSFNDQYISTGGQLSELILGRYRLCMDLRPIFFKILAKRTGRTISHGLECHPYDLATIKIATSAGVIITDGYGKNLSVPFELERPMHWRGYANEQIQKQIEPLINEWLSSKLNDLN